MADKIYERHLENLETYHFQHTVIETNLKMKGEAAKCFAKLLLMVNRLLPKEPFGEREIHFRPNG